MCFIVTKPLCRNVPGDFFPLVVVPCRILKKSVLRCPCRFCVGFYSEPHRLTSSLHLPCRGPSWMERAFFMPGLLCPYPIFPARQSGTATPKDVFDWRRKRPVRGLGEPQQAFRNIQKDIPETLLAHVTIPPDRTDNIIHRRTKPPASVATARYRPGWVNHGAAPDAAVRPFWGHLADFSEMPVFSWTDCAPFGVGGPAPQRGGPHSTFSRSGRKERPGHTPRPLLLILKTLGIGQWPNPQPVADHSPPRRMLIRFSSSAISYPATSSVNAPAECSSPW